MTSPHPRLSARLLLVDSQDRILLFHGSDPTEKKPDYWFTPGGGLEPDETYEQAATRELFEETGLADSPIGPCVWLRNSVVMIAGEPRLSVERYYLVRSPDEFQLSKDGFTAVERSFIKRHRWWSLPDLRTSSDTFYPTQLAKYMEPLLLGRFPPQPIDVGD